MRITKANLSKHRESHDKTNSWWMADARGIELCRVCDACEYVARSTFNPEVFGRYDLDEQVEED